MANIQYTAELPMERKLGEEIFEALGVTTHDELYEVLTFDVLRTHLKHRFKTLFNCQTLTFVRACYPEWAVCSWKFKSPLKHQWDDPDNCRFAIDYIAKQEGWTTRADYHKINGVLISKYIGEGLSDRYGGKTWNMMMELYPPADPTDRMADDYWYPWMMGELKTEEGERKRGRATPKGTFTEAADRRWYVEWLCRRCNLTIPDDLPKLTQRHFIDNYGKGMLVKHYKTSVYACLHDLFPEYKTSHLEWYMFTQKPKNRFADMDERLRAMRYVRQTMGLTVAEDFYDLSLADFEERNLGGLLYHSGPKGAGFAKIMQELNPDLVFDLAKFNRHKTEIMVTKFIEKQGFTVETQMCIYKTEYNSYFRMDVVIPALHLIIEIDGNQHFKGKLAFFQKIGHELILKRDVFKMQEARRKGFSIVRIAQMECWNGREPWLTTHLLPLLQKYSEPTTVFLTTTAEFSGVYEGHKERLATELTEADLYE